MNQSAATVEPTEDLLRRLTAGEERSLLEVLALTPESAGSCSAAAAALPPSVRMLVRLAALVALDASTASLRWAVELASCAGADEDQIAGVLVNVGPEVGLPCVVSAAPRLALAIGYEIEVEDWDGT